MEIERIQEVGIAVADLEATTKLYATILGAVPSQVMPVDAYGNRWRICRTGGMDLRFMEATEQNEIARLVSKRGDCLYHVGLSVSNIEEAIVWMVHNQIEMIDKMPYSEDGVRFAFVHPDSFRGVRFKLIEGEPDLDFHPDLFEKHIPEPATIERVLHLGINTLDLDATIDLYTRLLGTTPSAIFTREQFGMKANFNRLQDIHFELLSSTTEDGTIGRSIAKVGEGLSHICFEPSDVRATLAWMKQNNLRIINEEPYFSEWEFWKEKLWAAFTHPKAFNGVMFEFIQRERGV